MFKTVLSKTPFDQQDNLGRKALCLHQTLFHQATFTTVALYTNHLYTKHLLHHKPFTPKAFYTAQLFDQKPFIPEIARRVCSGNILTKAGLYRLRHSSTTLIRTALHQICPAFYLSFEHPTPHEPAEGPLANGTTCIFPSFERLTTTK